MGTSSCQCGAPATRLLKVAWADRAKRTDHQIGPASMDRSTRFAACEPHRKSAAEILAKQWATEIAAGTVKILMGKRYKAGL